VNKEMKAKKEWLDHKVLKVCKEFKVCKVFREFKDQLVHKVLEEIQVLKVLKVTRDPKDRRVLLDEMELLVEVEVVVQMVPLQPLQ
jgi:hypothetical protein